MMLILNNWALNVLSGEATLQFSILPPFSIGDLLEEGVCLTAWNQILVIVFAVSKYVDHIMLDRHDTS